MNHLLNLFAGSPPPETSSSSSSSNGNINNSNNDNRHRRRRSSSRSSRYNDADDDLYLSDADEFNDWGMSATTTTSSTTARDRYHDDDYDRRSGGHIFWDANNDHHRRPTAAGGGNDRRYHGRRSSMPPAAAREWEDESIVRDESGDGDAARRRRQRQRLNVFEIGDDPSSNSSNDADYYLSQVQDDLEELEEETEEGDGEDEDESNTNDNNETAKKDEVVNAYRDYLRSIRDGGFESYLDEDVVDDADYDDGDNDNKMVDRHRDVEEEDRRIDGSLYGVMYGIHDVRSNNSSSSSPYSAWRARARRLREEEEKTRQRGKRKTTVGGGDPFDFSYYDNTNNNDGPRTYRVAFVHRNKAWFRLTIMVVCLLVALTTGIHYYKHTNSSSSDSSSSSTPSSGGSTTTSSEVGGDMTTQQNNEQSKVGGGAMDAIRNALKIFDPVWYNRQMGWEGIMYTDAITFCKSHDSRVPCPYEIYCNQDDGVPYRGYRSNNEQWSAISNGYNQFVQVGGTLSCKRYTDLHDGAKPDWGITGISLDYEHGAGGITQNLMCCRDVYNIGSLDPKTEWGRHDRTHHVKEDITTTTSNSTVMQMEDGSNEKSTTNEGNVADVSSTTYEGTKWQDVDKGTREKDVISTFQPIWFSSAHGWSGGSYEDAIHFCESYNHMVLCPYAAYCPNGHANPPLPGSMMIELNEEWAPANGPMNTWVQVGEMGGDMKSRCTLHHDFLGERPEWGIDGTRTEIKHHIMCCLM